LKPVLVIDDDEDIRVLVSSILEEEGVEIILAANGIEGTALFDEHKPDIVITDIRMPKMNGLEVLRYIKEHKPETEVIVITGFGEINIAIEALQMEASDFIQKPFQINALLIAFRRALKKLEMRETLAQTQLQLLQSEKMASLGQLAAGVAHEINNPISYVKSNLDTLRRYIDNIVAATDNIEKFFRDKYGDEHLEKLNEIRKNHKMDLIVSDTKKIIEESAEGTSRIKQIVQDLKNYSHIDVNQLENCNVNDYILSSLNIIESELKYHCEIVKNLGELPSVLCFPQQIQQVVMNLLMNASQAVGDDGGKIEIITSPSAEGGVEIIVRDNGKGIPADIIDKIYDPFFTTRDVGEGTGLGLNIVYNIIKKHGGEIDVKSAVGFGTKFTVKLLPEPPFE